MGESVQITGELSVDVDDVVQLHMFRDGRNVVEYRDADGEIREVECTLAMDDVLQALALLESKRDDADSSGGE